MGFIDLLVNRSFRDEPTGRVVVFDGVGRGRGYLLRSLADEQRIRGSSGCMCSPSWRSSCSARCWWPRGCRTQRIALTLLVLLSLAAVLAIIHSCALATASALR